MASQRLSASATRVGADGIAQCWLVQKTVQAMACVPMALAIVSLAGRGPVVSWLHVIMIATHMACAYVEFASACMAGPAHLVTSHLTAQTSAVAMAVALRVCVSVMPAGWEMIAQCGVASMAAPNMVYATRVLAIAIPSGQELTALLLQTAPQPPLMLSAVDMARVPRVVVCAKQDGLAMIATQCNAQSIAATMARAIMVHVIATRATLAKLVTAKLVSMDVGCTVIVIVRVELANAMPAMQDPNVRRWRWIVPSAQMASVRVANVFVKLASLACNVTKQQNTFVRMVCFAITRVSVKLVGRAKCAITNCASARSVAVGTVPVWLAYVFVMMGGRASTA